MFHALISSPADFCASCKALPGLDAPSFAPGAPGPHLRADAKPGHTCAHSLSVYVLLLTLVMLPLHEVLPNKSGFLVIIGLHCTFCIRLCVRLRCMSPATGRTDMISATRLIPFEYVCAAPLFASLCSSTLWCSNKSATSKFRQVERF